MTKKKEETPIKTEEKAEAEPSAETEQVTTVADVLPEEEAQLEPENKAPEPVIISEMPTKKRVAPVNFVDNDEKVFEWYNSLSADEKYSRQEAADELELSLEEFNNSINRLQQTLLGETLGHLLD